MYFAPFGGGQLIKGKGGECLADLFSEATGAAFYFSLAF